MLARYEKSAITKAIRRYIKKEYSVNKVEHKRKDGSGYYILITPNSDMLYIRSWGENWENVNRISIPRFSDYIVTIGEFNDFITKFRANSK